MTNYDHDRLIFFHFCRNNDKFGESDRSVTKSYQKPQIEAKEKLTKEVKSTTTTHIYITLYIFS